MCEFVADPESIERECAETDSGYAGCEADPLEGGCWIDWIRCEVHN
jgi:hypothetical protein